MCIREFPCWPLSIPDSVNRRHNHTIKKFEALSDESLFLLHYEDSCICIVVWESSPKLRNWNKLYNVLLGKHVFWYLILSKTGHLSTVVSHPFYRYHCTKVINIFHSACQRIRCYTHRHTPSCKIRVLFENIKSPPLLTRDLVWCQCCNQLKHPAWREW